MKIYSNNDELFNYTDLNECVTDFMDNLDDEDFKEGNIFNIYEGVRVTYKASKYISSCFAEELGERSDDDCHEDYFGEWPNASGDQEKDLISEVKKVVDAWADKYDLQPKFYGVKDIKKINIRITKIPAECTNVFDVEWEIVERERTAGAV